MEGKNFNFGPEDKQEDTKKTPEIEVVTPVGAGGRKISKEEIDKSKKVLKEEDDKSKKILKEEAEMKDLKDKKGRGKLLSAYEAARLKELKMKKEKNEDESEKGGNESEEEKSEEESEEEGDNKEKIDTGVNLEAARNEYIEQYQEFLQSGRLARLRNSLGISPSKKKEMPEDLKNAKAKYDQAKQEYAQNEWKTSVENLSFDLSEEQKKEEEAEIMNKINNIVVLDEEDYMQEARTEAFPPSEKGMFSKAYQRWTNLSKTKRIAYSVAMVGGAAGFASLGAPVSSAAAAIGIGGAMGQKALRGTLGALVSVVAGKAYDKISKSKEKKKEITKTATDETEEARKSFNIDNLADVEKRYQEAIKQEEKENKKILMKKIGVMAAAGIGTTVGVGMLDNCIAGELSSDTGGKLDTKSEAGANPADAEAGKESTEAAAAASKPAEDLESYSVEKGDNLWDTLKNNIPQIEDLDRAGMKDNVTANLIEEIKENPEEYGIESDNVGNLQIGDNLKMEKIQDLLENEKIDGDGLIEHAKGLSEDQLKGIENYEPPESSGAAEAAESSAEESGKGSGAEETSEKINTFTERLKDLDIDADSTKNNELINYLHNHEDLLNSPDKREFLEELLENQDKVKIDSLEKANSIFSLTENIDSLDNTLDDYEKMQDFFEKIGSQNINRDDLENLAQLKFGDVNNETVSKSTHNLFAQVLNDSDKKVDLEKIMHFGEQTEILFSEEDAPGWSVIIDWHEGKMFSKEILSWSSPEESDISTDALDKINENISKAADTTEPSAGESEKAPEAADTTEDTSPQEEPNTSGGIRPDVTQANEEGESIITQSLSRENLEKMKDFSEFDNYLKDQDYYNELSEENINGLKERFEEIQDPNVHEIDKASSQRAITAIITNARAQ